MNMIEHVTVGWNPLENMNLEASDANSFLFSG